MECGAFHAGHELHNSAVAYVLDEAIDDLIAELAVGHLAAAKTQGRLDLVAFLKEADGPVFLGLVVVLVDGDGELDFLDDDDFLLFAGRSLALVFLVEIFAVVLNAANRGNRVRRDFDQVETALAGDFQGFKGGEDSELLPIFVDDANFTRSNPIVDANKLFCRTFIDLPPPSARECARLVSITFALKREDVADRRWVASFFSDCFR